MKQSVKLSGKKCLIIGASSGIGAKIAGLFAEEGAGLILASRNIDALSRLGARLVKHSSVDVYRCDATVEADVLELFSFIKKNHGGLDVLVNCQGMARYEKFEEHTLKTWNETLNVNLTSMFLTMREAFRLMMKKKRGRIINLSSMTGIEGTYYKAAYVASKFGVEGLSKAVAMEGELHNIKVTTICPGGVDTPFWDKNPSFRPPRELSLKPRDIAELVLYVASLDDRVMINQIVIKPNYCLKKIRGGGQNG